ncbi:2Fe-2S ferredoxin [Bacterioplanes sanyensis]|uniref:2Fe-2S ferredoxin n=1 Tax=Bacterioplanes sanyensis TaxID=1249553 RepID=A0A222FKC1_9GAMM|nr:2Fe-2S iron-sulfur cluster-binding protein [Bacterioplanes sanyensis]ASP39102.1 2Fe-2S ferredoxin [Bacterioplanes sanyensis]
MATITFVEHNGSEHTVDLEVGKTLMQHALDGLVPGIDGDCGGACACGTCHVMVATSCSSDLVPPSLEEQSMLALKPEHCESSRLACQIDITEQHDGLIVQLPEFQM